MTNDEYNLLFHKTQANTSAFKRLMDCDAEVIKMIEAVVEPESQRLQELSGKTEELEAEIKRLQELADYRLKLLTKMPSQWVGLTAVETMKQALDALYTTDTHPISSAEQYDKEIRAMEALEDAIADAEETTVDWEAVAADQAMTIAMMRQREWVGLKDEEALDVWGKVDYGKTEEQGALLLYKAIEAKLKEKNCG